MFHFDFFKKYFFLIVLFLSACGYDFYTLNPIPCNIKDINFIQNNTNILDIGNLLTENISIELRKRQICEKNKDEREKELNLLVSIKNIEIENLAYTVKEDYENKIIVSIMVKLIDTKEDKTIFLENFEEFETYFVYYNDITESEKGKHSAIETISKKLSEKISRNILR